MNSYRFLIVVFLISASCLLLVGCGSNGGVPISGAVRFVESQQPVEEGSIVFEPTEGTQARRVAAKIVDGQYHFDRKAGPLPGTYRVEIYGPAPSGLDDPLAFQQSGTELLNSEQIAAEFNSQSQLTAQVGTEGSAIDFEVRRATSNR